MAKYEITATITVPHKAVIEAYNEDHAWQLAEDMEGSEFVKEKDTRQHEWSIYNVSEIKETE
tara:strand:- start:76 stop:261 length:186 start_codon:yes stop_codon:yes gene_type:complete